MGIYTGFGLESMIQLLLEGEVLWMYGLILLVLLAISRFGILWTANSPLTLGNDRQFGEIGNNWLRNNEISLYIGIDHPDVPLSQLSNNGLLINNISDISNYKIHVKTWCNFFDTYSTAGMMLGSDIRNQGDALVAPSNSSSNLNGFDFLNPIQTRFYRVIDLSPNIYNPIFSTSFFPLYSPNLVQSFNQGFDLSLSENSCANVPGYQRNSIPLNSNDNFLNPNASNIIIVFPNPFETEFRIESSSVAIKEIALFDVLGRSMLTEVGLLEKTHLINLNTAPGCYLLKVVLANGELTYHKIVKSND